MYLQLQSPPTHLGADQRQGLGVALAHDTQVHAEVLARVLAGEKRAVALAEELVEGLRNSRERVKVDERKTV